MLAAVCATTTIVSMAPSFVSANPHYENIIDKNSQKPEDIERNAIRKRVNDKFTKEILEITPDIGSKLENIKLDISFGTEKMDFVDSNVKNKFDHMIYYDIALRKYQPGSHAETNYLKPLERKHNPQVKTNFNFLSAKIAIANELIENENDLIKQFLLTYAYKDMLQIDNPTDMSTECGDPYHLKKITEKIYLHCMKDYYRYYINNNHNNNNNIDQNNLQAKKAKHKAAIEEAKESLDQWKTKQEAYAAALCDAENQTERALNQNDDDYIKTYYKTLALANAEIHAKSSKGRINKTILNKNMQTEYNEAYNKQFDNVVKQIGIRDGLEANECQPSSYNLDESAKKIYREGYLIGAKKRAEENIIDVHDGQCETLEYKEIYADKEAQKTYLKSFLDTIYKGAFSAYSTPYECRFEQKESWDEFLKTNDDDTQEMIEFKEQAKNLHREGRLKGCEELGYKYATTKNYEHRYNYTFELCMKINPIKSEEFKNECEKAYKNGIERGLTEIGKKMEIEEKI